MFELSKHDQDHTPQNFKVLEVSKLENFKRIIRRVVYPFYTAINNIYLKHKFKSIIDHRIDKVLLGHRGSDYETLRRKVNFYNKIKGKDILVVGCGTGRDLDSWLKYKPRKLVGVDLFRYDEAWRQMKDRFKDLYPYTKVDFTQNDLNSLNISDTFDFVVSDAVFEHLRNFDLSLKNITGVLNSGGILYATFGPLWYTWGGDHIGGELKKGYNHLLLNKEAYHKHLQSQGEYKHHENDGRTWLYNDLFSYLKPNEYLDKLDNNNLFKEYVSGMIEVRALNFKKKFPQDFEKLKTVTDEQSLILTGMTIIYRKK